MAAGAAVESRRVSDCRAYRECRLTDGHLLGGDTHNLVGDSTEASRSPAGGMRHYTHSLPLDDYIQVSVPPYNFSFDFAFRVFDDVKGKGDMISRGIFSSLWCQIRLNNLYTTSKIIVEDSGRGRSLSGTVDLVSSLLGRHCPQANANDQ